MRVVYVEPHKAPYTAEIAHTLEAEQKAVGGLIEPIDNDDGTCLVGNEDRSSVAWTEIAGSAMAHPSLPAPSSSAATRRIIQKSHR